MQPYFFPYIGYFQLINAVDKFVILDDVNFIKGGWINRNYILVNKKRTLFTIPVSKLSQNRFINETEISYDTDWSKKILSTLEKSYRKAPNFSDTYGLISGILSGNYRYINELIKSSIIEIKKYLNINTEILLSSERNYGKEFKGEERIIDICIKENAVQYINPSGGAEIYSKENFLNKGIKLNFLKSGKLKYSQFGIEFVESLSMIDVLMFNPKNKIQEFLNEYELI